MNYTIVTNKDKLRLHEALIKADRAALDVETTPVPWYDPGFKLLTIAISIEPGHAWVIPVDHAEADEDIDLDLCFPFIPNQPKWVMQNGSFDWIAMHKYGIELRRPWFDTMVVQYLLDVEAPKNLEALALRWLGQKKWKDIDYKAPEEEDLQTLARLNANDADVTLRLFDPMAAALTAVPELRQLYTKLMVPLSEALVDMELQGVPVDRERLLDLHAEVGNELDGLLDDIRDVAGNDTFNPNSFQQLGKLLYQDLGLPCPIFTDTGSPSTKAEALKKIEDMHHVVPMVMRFKQLRKLYTASLVPWLNKLTDDDLLHPRYKPAHVKTGRLSSEMPNIQQVPREERVRRIFGGLKDHLFVEIDYAQLELRIVAWVAGEETMLEAFRNGEDLHQITANEFGVDRQTAKAVNFGLLYGAGPRKLRWIAKEQYNVDISEMKAEALRSQWFDKYTAIEDYHEAAIAEARETGMITTALGRRRRLPDINNSDYAKKGGAERQAVNTPIQSLASDITLFKLQEIKNNKTLDRVGVDVIGTIHDSLLFLIPVASRHLVPVLQGIMEDVSVFKEEFGIDLDVPLTTEAKINSHWGSN